MLKLDKKPACMQDEGVALYNTDTCDAKSDYLHTNLSTI